MIVRVPRPRGPRFAAGSAAGVTNRGTSTAANEIAGVIVEPVAGNMGLVAPAPGFLEALRTLTAKHGAILIFDEVMTGFRVAYGGAQALYKITPDLSCFGKIIGGGLPVGAYGGRKEIMAHIAPQGPVYQAGTLSGNPLAMAAGIATLKQLQKKGFYAKLEKKSVRLTAGLAQAAAQERHAVAIMEPETADPIAAVRERHCHKCVESRAQATAIFALRGEALPEKYDKEFTTFSYGSAAQWWDQNGHFYGRHGGGVIMGGNGNDFGGSFGGC